ncbi:MAG: GntR family transcriptional regulator [Paenibacillus sp.]|jgi:multiple sugar transport system substrate-binding protein|nr:GntR family transcriptional regulator [Paenibacillus sp.]
MMNRPDRVTFKKRQEEMLASIRSDIDSGILLPGDLIPSEQELSKQFQLSRNSVRGALEQLQNEQVVEKIANVGNKVTANQRKQPIQLKMGVYKSAYRDMAIEDLLHDYHKANPNVRIQLVTLPEEDSFQTIETYVQNNMLDLMTVNYTHFRQIQERGTLHELFEPLDDKPEVYPFLSNPYKTQDQVWLRPVIFSPVILCYNKKHFSEMGLLEPDSSWSWETLTEAAKALSEGHNRFGFYFFLLSENRWSVFLLQNGVRFTRHADGKLNIRHPGFTSMMEYCRELLFGQADRPLYMLESENDAELLFRQEKASMIITTYFNLNYFKDCDFPIDIAPLPSSGQYKTLLLNIGIAVSQFSTLKGEAVKFADYLISHAGQLAIRQHTYSLPSVKAIAESDGYKSEYLTLPSRFMMFREIFPTFNYYTELNLTPSEFNMIRKELRLFWANLETVEQFCDRMDQLL